MRLQDGTWLPPPPLSRAPQVAGEAVNVRRPVGELRWSHLLTVLQ
jgi:hypothetical protein